MELPKIKYKELREFFSANMDQIPDTTYNPAPHITYGNMRQNVQDDLQLIEDQMSRLQKRERIIKSSPINAAVGRLRSAYHYISSLEQKNR